MTSQGRSEVSVVGECKLVASVRLAYRLSYAVRFQLAWVSWQVLSRLERSPRVQNEKASQLLLSTVIKVSMMVSKEEYVDTSSFPKAFIKFC